MERLTIKQKKFADLYIELGNATEAYLQSYAWNGSRNGANTNAQKLKANPKVKRYLEKRMAEIDDAAIAKQEEVLKYLTSVMRGETASTEIVVEACGDGFSEARTVEKEPSEKDRLKAAELLGKRYGIWTDKTELAGDMELKIEVDYGDDDSSGE